MKHKVNDEMAPRERDVRKTLWWNIVVFIPVAFMLYLLLWIPVPVFFLLGATLYGGFVGAITAKSFGASGFFGVQFWTIATPVVTGYLAGTIFGAMESFDDVPRMLSSPVDSWLSSYFYCQSTARGLVGGVLGLTIGVVISGLGYVSRVSQRLRGPQSPASMPDRRAP